MITRRAFLGSAASAALVAATRSPLTASTARARVPAIDTHVHIYDTTRPQGVSWPDKNDPADASIFHPNMPIGFAALTAPYRVLGEVVIEASMWNEDNQWMLDLAKKSPGIVAYMGHVDPGSPDFPKNLKRFSGDPIFRGVRLRNSVPILKRMDEPAFRKHFAQLADQRLCVDASNPGPVLPEIVHLAERYPHLRIILDHLPFNEWDGKPEEMRSALTAAAACPNIYAKISWVIRHVNGPVTEDPAFYRPGLDVLYSLFGPDRVLYGSNWTASARKATYDNIYRVVADYFATKSMREQENFFWRNSIAAYSWIPRGEAARLLQA